MIITVFAFVAAATVRGLTALRFWRLCNRAALDRSRGKSHLEKTRNQLQMNGVGFSLIYFIRAGCHV
jgi:hypothetical protein